MNGCSSAAIKFNK